MGGKRLAKQNYMNMLQESISVLKLTDKNITSCRSPVQNKTWISLSVDNNYMIVNNNHVIIDYYYNY